MTQSGPAIFSIKTCCTVNNDKYIPDKAVSHLFMRRETLPCYNESFCVVGMGGKDRLLSRAVGQIALYVQYSTVCAILYCNVLYSSVL